MAERMFAWCPRCHHRVDNEQCVIRFTLTRHANGKTTRKTVAMHPRCFERQLAYETAPRYHHETTTSHASSPSYFSRAGYSRMDME